MTIRSRTSSVIALMGLLVNSTACDTAPKDESRTDDFRDAMVVGVELDGALVSTVHPTDESLESVLTIDEDGMTYGPEGQQLVLSNHADVSELAASNALAYRLWQAHSESESEAELVGAGDLRAASDPAASALVEAPACDSVWPNPTNTHLPGGQWTVFPGGRLWVDAFSYPWFYSSEQCEADCARCGVGYSSGDWVQTSGLLNPAWCICHDS